jgi:hypothetical protein
MSDPGIDQSAGGPGSNSPLPSGQACHKSDRAHQGNYKGKTKGSRQTPYVYSSPAEDIKEGVGESSGRSLASAFSDSATFLRSISRSLRSRSSHSDASLLRTRLELASPQLPAGGLTPSPASGFVTLLLRNLPLHVWEGGGSAERYLAPAAPIRMP